ncbi:Up-regulated during septation-domain-containing protein [Rhexocercosporidium sp. MPI-PUGE-AT-0058]|nr:Up-regulated during septation-domain-containing protein [Rhexocercosporidium sp. MPI-PUGE-AT-0058]
MAHIADLMVGPSSSLGLNNYIARELSPPPPKETSSATNESSCTDDSEKYVWRMHQPTEPRKYQLFPAAKEKLSIAAGQKNGEAESSQSTVAGQNGTNEKDRSLLTNALRLGLKPKEQAVNRRRKPSMPAELGPMTTVQEVAMDSPTIPGRPPLHERSISAPGNSWRQHVFGESMLSCISGPALDENAEMAISPDSGSNGQAQANIQETSQFFDDEDISQPLPAPTSYSSRNKSRSASPKQQPLSPKSLTPLVIPQSTSTQPQQRLNRQSSTSRMRSRSGSGSSGSPPDVPPKSARMMEVSPHPRASPYTPMSGSSSTLLSASTAATSVSTTPNTPFALPQFPLEGRCSPKPLPNPQFPLEGRSSPRPWNGTSCSPVTTSATSQSHMCHTKSSSDAAQHSLTHQRSFPVGPVLKGHRRHESESAASIMDRGRPKRRSPSEGSPVKRSNSKTSSSIPTSACTTHPLTRSPTPGSYSPRDRSEEQRAFEHLPTGHTAATAHTHLPTSEIASLRKQAIGQASRFQVLCTKDVEALSRELRALDERCEYLRKTHRSLRSGRRNLHERICTYLRSPRVARFSHESMLRQEEALSELDTSIDDWVSKLEQAENRRTRVRQKLLEHVAAALMMNSTSSPTSDEALGLLLGGGENIKPHVTSQAPSRDPNTPPRSPTKSSSPERLERVVEEVKVSSPEAPLRTSRRCVESIRIYADSDISALMADVEDEIKRMGEEPTLDGEATPTPVVEKKEEEQLPMLLNAVAFEGMALHKQRSAGKLK